MTDQSPHPTSTPSRQRQQGTWSSGDYAVIGTTLQIVGETLCEAVDVAAGERVLDVAAGNGNVVARGRPPRRERHRDRLRAGPARRDAQPGGRRGPDDRRPRSPTPRRCRSPTPRSTSSLSTFGVMFTPNQEQSAAELMRVCRPGGPHRARELDARGLHRPDVQDRRSLRCAAGGHPLAARVGQGGAAGRAVRRSCTKLQLPPQASSCSAIARPSTGSTRSASYYGPTHKAFAALDSGAQSGLEQDLLTLAREHNTSGGRGLRIPGTYLEIVARRCSCDWGAIAAGGPGLEPGTS